MVHFYKRMKPKSKKYLERVTWNWSNVYLRQDEGSGKVGGQGSVQARDSETAFSA